MIFEGKLKLEKISGNSKRYIRIFMMFKRIGWGILKPVLCVRKMYYDFLKIDGNNSVHTKYICLMRYSKKKVKYCSILRKLSSIGIKLFWM